MLVQKNNNLKALKLNEIKDAMETVPNWDHTASYLECDFVFKNFKEALQFLNQVAELAELQQHHPIFIHNFNKLKKLCWIANFNSYSHLFGWK